MGQQGGRSRQEQPFPLQQIHPDSSVQAVASPQGEQVLPAQVGVEQRLVAGWWKQYLRAWQTCWARGIRGAGRLWGAGDHQVMSSHEKWQGCGGQSNGHHIRVPEGRVQSGGGCQSQRFRRLAGPHHPRQGQQHGIEEPALELPHPVGSPQESQAQLHLPAALWR